MAGGWLCRRPRLGYGLHSIAAEEKFMGQVILQLPKTEAEWIEAQVAAGRFPDAESFVAELVARDRADAARLEILRAAIDEGLNSGISERTLDEIFEEAMARARA